ncbi:MAG: SAM-dependent chlorinase/fluorinase [Bacteroidales bacterium]|nr:SAM-dependent chlorinase/fluorinase [Candidatus Latescibacterota bacterium]
MNPSSIIVLLTDFGSSSWYIGVMKGVILSIAPQARIVDLCHNVSSQDVREGSFILGNSYRYFPVGSVFVCVIDPGVGGERKNLIIETDKHYFVGPDNGIFTPVFEDNRSLHVHQVTSDEYTLAGKGSTFLGRDLFAPVAAHISLGVDPSSIGPGLSTITTMPRSEPVIKDGLEIRGRIAYIDSFGNIITDISREALDSVFADSTGARLKVVIGGRTVEGIKEYYGQEVSGRLMAVINSWGYLELAVNMGSAWEYLGLREKRSVSIVVTRRGNGNP